jgi:hypothetical protein
MIGGIVESKWNAMARQDVPDRDAEGRPGKLEEGEHGGYMTQEKSVRLSKSAGNPNQLSHGENCT